MGLTYPVLVLGALGGGNCGNLAETMTSACAATAQANT
jgi:hypothetical protein